MSQPQSHLRLSPGGLFPAPWLEKEGSLLAGPSAPAGAVCCPLCPSPGVGHWHLQKTEEGTEHLGQEPWAQRLPLPLICHAARASVYPTGQWVGEAEGGEWLKGPAPLGPLAPWP